MMGEQVAGTHVALLRGINVGRSKRIAMADLRRLVTNLGFSGVSTLLNSGNVVFSAEGDSARDAGVRIGSALAATLGIHARVTVLRANELAQVIRENPLLDVAGDHSRLLVAVFDDPADRGLLGREADAEWAPGLLRFGTRAAYLWCPQGVLASPLFMAAHRAVGSAATMRNWSTLIKLDALANAPLR